MSVVVCRKPKNVNQPLHKRDWDVTQRLSFYGVGIRIFFSNSNCAANVVFSPL